MLRTLSRARTHLNSSRTLTLTKTLTSFSQSTLSLSSLSKEHKKSADQSKDGGSLLINTDPTSPPRLFLVQPRLRPPTFLQAKLNEALCLANSLEEQREGYFEVDFFEKELPPHVVVQNPSLKSKIHADIYFGPGTVKDIKCHINAAESEEEVDAVFVNAILSGVQQRNLERKWDRPVLDRVGLIIEIFNAHAHTKEAKLQAELAALMYKKSRLVRTLGADGRLTFGSSGEAEVVSARGRGSGGRGFISGAGETELQLQRRRIIDRRNHLLSQIENVRRTRALQRASRKRQTGVNGQSLVTVAVVGYTNAGKSTLISALSDTDLYCNERLFATLDPRLKSIVLPSGRKILLSDTVGFISDLPVQLVEAFQSTLEEVVEADLLVHLVDSTAPNLEEHRSTVLQVLRQIGVSDEKLNGMIEVWNKIDYEDDESMEDGEYLEVGDDAEESGLSEEAEYVEVSSNPSDAKGDNNNDEDIGSLSELSSETLNDEQSDYSDGWLEEDEDNNVDEHDKYFKYGDVNNNEPIICSDMGKLQKDSHSETEQSPDVKISALTGIGLQELLEVIDERLKTQDDKLKSLKVMGNSIYDRKWRPPVKEEGNAAVEQ